MPACLRRYLSLFPALACALSYGAVPQAAGAGETSVSLGAEYTSGITAPPATAACGISR